MHVDSTHFEEMTQDDVIKKLTAFKESKILLSSCEIGLFDCLHIYGKTSKEISDELNVDLPALDKILDALVGMGFLVKDKNVYSNSNIALEYFVKQSVDYIGGISSWTSEWDFWSNLTYTLKKGTSKNQIQIDDNIIRASIEKMHWNALRNSIELVSAIDLSKVFRMIDIGGASGVYSFEFARAKPGLRSVVFDLPEVIPITQEYIEREKLSRKVSTIAGDYLVDDLGSGYELAFMSSIVHLNTVEENFLLFERIYDVLNRGGKVVVQDYIVNIERTEPTESSKYALEMLLSNEKGMVYTITEILMMMKSALFSDVKHYATPFGSTIFIGRK